jgi:hypothetical protein
VSEDFRHANKVASELKIPLLPVFRHPNAVCSAIGQAVLLCQDWRDFNVHCAAVNLFLAQDIRAAFPGTETIVITGDLMNEYVCDYHEEAVDGKTYYPQPRVSLAKRRRFFVRGLDAGDREVGIFNAYQLPVVQIFSVVADLYMEVPENFLELPDAKEKLNASMLPSGVRDAVSIVKQRAQVGGHDKGTLGIFHRLGIGQSELAQIWANQLPIELVGENPHDIIQVGRYRFKPRSSLIRDH